MFLKENYEKSFVKVNPFTYAAYGIVASFLQSGVVTDEFLNLLDEEIQWRDPVGIESSYKIGKESVEKLLIPFNESFSWTSTVDIGLFCIL